jgi:hypothetical protein
VWIAIVIYQGIHKEPEVKIYWNRDTNFPIHRISKMMTLVRYGQIKRFIHIPSPFQGKVVYYKKAEPLLSHVREMSKKLYTPKSNVSLDEMIVGLKERSKDTYRMKLKPIPEG